MRSTTVIAEKAWNTCKNPNTPESKPGFNFTRLLNSRGLQCCLGFECEQCGVPRSAIWGRPTPCGIADKSDLAKVPHLLGRGGNSAFACEAIDINDSAFLSHKAKKAKLKALWAEQGWKLIFVKTVAQMKRKIKELKARGE